MPVGNNITDGFDDGIVAWQAIIVKVVIGVHIIIDYA